MAPLDRPRALVFIGFMGAGKSAALDAARAAGLETADSDALIEAELGEPIEAFFDREGEAAFRQREEDIVVRLLDSPPGAVALGGGAVTSERVRDALGAHAVVWLGVDAETAWGRARGRGRPLARDRELFEALHAQREAIYAQLADVAIPAGDRGRVARALPSIRRLAESGGGVRLAWGTSASGDYPVFFGRGVLARTGALAPLERGRRFCVTDENVGALYAEALEPLAGRIEVPAGERAKTLAQFERVMRELASAGMTRDDELLAVGGGVVGDLAGFCAATYQRGVDVVHVPTSLVAQVDSAYGGKTGVDLPEAKNYVGAYHLPRAVLTDPETLATLPQEELAAGFAEVVKTALIAGGMLWERVRALDSLDPSGLDDIIFGCLCTKLAVVAADERDSGRRQALNLGHTVGHAIETASAYNRYRHGEAVGLGLLAALELSGATELREEVLEVLARAGLPTRLDPGIATDDVLAATARDKKVTSAGLAFVLCPRPGEVVTGQAVDSAALRAAVERLAQTG